MFPGSWLTMLVYGDPIRTDDPRTVIEQLRSGAAALSAPQRWIERHTRLVALFIRAAELAQGLVDEEFRQAGCDHLSARQSASAGALRGLARAVLRSWREQWVGREADVAAAIDRLAAIDAPDPVSVKTPEGYAFYALYPEAYGLAASILQGSSPMVLGLRSIGIGLGAMVAAGSGAAWSLSLRPVGHPFRRKLALGADVVAALGGLRDSVFAIADEGPGLSGSSMAAVARMLEEQVGVPRQRIHFFPSHGNPPGSAATPDIIERWRSAPRHCTPFEGLMAGTAPRQRLASWVEDLTGKPTEPLRDISGGGWRELKRYPGRPPIHAQQERRKFLLESARGRFLLRFAGLDPHGEATLRRARRLSDAGFTPPVLGLRHGFLVEHWLDDARPLDLAADRDQLVGHVARYLAFRARQLPGGKTSGASLEALAGMCAHNLAEALGEGRGSGPSPEMARQLEGRVRRVDTDNRLHAWEWLRRADGRIIKTDAYDHCAGHDLVGCQDIAWDVAGACCELDMDDGELARLLRELAMHGVRIDEALLDFYAPCYLAFQIGRLALAGDAAAEEEKSTIFRAIKSYRYRFLEPEYYRGGRKLLMRRRLLPEPS